MYDVKYQWEKSFSVTMLLLFFGNFIDDLAGTGTASFIFTMKALRASVTLHKTVWCVNIYLPCCSDTLQVPKICAVVHTSLLCRVHMASVVILLITTHV